ncbi:MAG: alpha/beta hydrolase [Flavobacteriaceae bacterium]|nr:alpha/beta hydrolase [Flavobacteriaceae bacterium]
MTSRFRYFFLFISTVISLQAQTLTLKKGVILDSIPTVEVVTETYSLFLPSDFNTDRTWPLLLVFDMEGRSTQALRMFRKVAEEQGYILAGPDNVSDTLSIADNILVSDRLLTSIKSILPIASSRVYSAGFDSGGKMAGLAPLFIKGIQGVISCGAVFPNSELLSSTNRFHYIGIVGNEDYNYTDMIKARSSMNTLRFTNNLFVFKGGHQWPSSELLGRALSHFTIGAMSKKLIGKDEDLIAAAYTKDLRSFETLKNSGALLLAERHLNDMLTLYRPHLSIDSLRVLRKSLRKNKQFKTQQRLNTNYRFRETLLKDDYVYYLEEDVLTYNYNNLGWWTFQMEKLKTFANSPISEEQLMGKRLLGFANALVEDQVILSRAEDDPEAVLLLWMLKTITDPRDYSYYLKIIQETSLQEDFGTALFYLEEAFKNGFTDLDALSNLEHTGLLRIMPEYKELLESYSTNLEE